MFGRNCLAAVPNLTRDNIKYKIKPFHSQKMIQLVHATLLEQDPCMGVKISKQIVPKYVQSTCLTTANLQQPCHTCFL